MLLIVLLWGVPLLFQPPPQFAGRPIMHFPFLWLCPVRPLYPAPEASRTADVGELRQLARELASFFWKEEEKEANKKNTLIHNVAIGCYWLIRLTWLIHLTQFTLTGSAAKVNSNKAHIGAIDTIDNWNKAWMHGRIQNKQGKSGHSTSAYLTKALDSWLDPCQWNWQYNYQLKSVLFLRALPRFCTQTKGTVRRTIWLPSTSGEWLPSATCLAYPVDVKSGAHYTTRYVLLFWPECEGSSSWWRWLFGESLGKEMKFWKALKVWKTYLLNFID